MKHLETNNDIYAGERFQKIGAKKMLNLKIASLEKQIHNLEKTLYTAMLTSLKISESGGKKNLVKSEDLDLFAKLILNLIAIEKIKIVSKADIKILVDTLILSEQDDERFSDPEYSKNLNRILNFVFLDMKFLKEGNRSNILEAYRDALNQPIPKHVQEKLSKSIKEVFDKYDKGLLR